MSASLQLFRLQKIDSQIGAFSRRISTLQAELENDKDLVSAKNSYAKAQEAYEKSMMTLHLAEEESQKARVKIDQITASLYSGKIKNPKELQDLENDLAVLRRRLIQIEDQQLIFMGEVEETLKIVESTKNEVTLLIQSTESKNSVLRGEIKGLENEVALLYTQREAVLPGIDSASLNLYNLLLKKKSGVAVAQVVDNSCNACGSSLTPGFAQSIRSTTQLVTCPMCGRFLYSD